MNDNANVDLVLGAVEQTPLQRCIVSEVRDRLHGIYLDSSGGMLVGGRYEQRWFVVTRSSG